MRKNIHLLALLAMTTLGACSGGDKTAENTADEKPRVKLATVTARPVDQIAEYTATVKADVTNKIAPSVPVRIRQIKVEVGDRVIKGQRLVEMDDVNEAQTKLNMENAQIEFNRVDEIYKAGGVSKSNWDAAKTQLEVLKRSYENLLENTWLVSPINGIITARNYDNGDLYNGSSPVVVVEQITPVKLVINVAEQSYAAIKLGMPISVKLDVYGDEEFEGKVSLIYPSIDVTTRTFQVEVKLANRDQRVRPGMFARATINFGTENHVVVPDLAVVKRAGSGDRYVYVYNDGKVSYNKVILGRRMGGEYELISGVDNNAQVVIAGQASLLNGMEVTVEQ
jgi:RND family efflux transporter MFP subunit